MADVDFKTAFPYTWRTTAEQVAKSEGVDLTGKNILITGATSGLGKETARVLVSRGANVFMACRNVEKANAVAKEISPKEGEGFGKIEIVKCDLTSLKSVREAADEFNKKDIPLNVLINNAGVMACPYSVTEDGLEMQMGTNHFGHFLLTNLLIDALKRGQPSRVVVLSSIAHQMDKGRIYYNDLTGEGTWYRGVLGPWWAYAQSKAANALFAFELNRRFKEEGVDITAFSLHPGVISTELMRFLPLPRLISLIAWPICKSIPQGASTTTFLAVSEKVKAFGGQYFADCKPAKPSPAVVDPENGKKLWDLSVKMVGL